MNIKKIVKLSFVVIATLVFLIFFANSIILYQIQENDLSKNHISQLVSMQENMNSLVKDILNANTKEELQTIKEEFSYYEKEFEKTKKFFAQNDENDFVDTFISDMHKNPIISQNLDLLDRKSVVEGKSVFVRV